MKIILTLLILFPLWMGVAQPQEPWTEEEVPPMRSGDCWGFDEASALVPVDPEERKRLLLNLLLKKLFSSFLEIRIVVDFDRPKPPENIDHWRFQAAGRRSIGRIGIINLDMMHSFSRKLLLPDEKAVFYAVSKPRDRSCYDINDLFILNQVFMDALNRYPPINGNARSGHVAGGSIGR